jgi:hypothetical protein
LENVGWFTNWRFAIDSPLIKQGMTVYVSGRKPIHAHIGSAPPTLEYNHISTFSTMTSYHISLSKRSVLSHFHFPSSDVSFVPVRREGGKLRRTLGSMINDRTIRLALLMFHGVSTYNFSYNSCLVQKKQTARSDEKKTKK